MRIETDDKAQKELNEFLASYGLDAHRIDAFGWDEQTYKEIAIDVNGRAMTRDDAVLLTEKTWPEGFDTQELLRLHRRVFGEV